MKQLDPHIWSPHVWFYLYSVAHCYPDTPTAVTKRKYYDFIQNIPLFIPNTSCSNYFSRLLDTFPVTPYLDSRDSFTYWVHCVHNRLNQYLGIVENTYLEHLDIYYKEFLPKEYVMSNKCGIKKKYIVFSVIAIMFFFIIWYYPLSR